MKIPCLKRLILPALLLLASLKVFAQKIENIRPSVNGDKIHIRYDLTGIPDQQAVAVQVYLSTDGGASFGEALKSVSGDVGIVLGPGRDRLIIWNVFDEVDELQGDDVKFRIRADLIRSPGNAKALSPGYTLALNGEWGKKAGRWTWGSGLKAGLTLKQLGLGVKGLFYRNFTEAGTDRYNWGYSGGLVLDYDMLHNPALSLYPYMFVGQTKYLQEEPDITAEHSAYSIFYSPGIGFSMRIARFLYLGIEMEYSMAPRIEIVDRSNNQVVENIIWDGLSAGIVLKFVKEGE